MSEIRKLGATIAPFVFGTVFLLNALTIVAEERVEIKDSSARSSSTDARADKTKERSKRPNAKNLEKARRTFLELEEEAIAKSPEVEKDAVVIKEYSRRLPLFWRELNLSERQIARTYKIKKTYHERIAKLQARVERLLRERDEAMATLLNDEQRETLERLTREAQMKRAKKGDAKALDEEEEVVDEEEEEELYLDEEEDEEDFYILM